MPDKVDVAFVLSELEEKRARLKQDLAQVDALIAQFGSWVQSALALVQPGTISHPTPVTPINSSESKETLTARIIGLLDETPEQVFSPLEMAEALTVSPNDINARTSYLVKNHRIAKVGRGEYRSIRHSSSFQAEIALAV